MLTQATARIVCQPLRRRADYGAMDQPPGLIQNLQFWKSLRNDFLNLNNYVDGVNRQIWHREYERQNGPILGDCRLFVGKRR